MRNDTVRHQSIRTVVYRTYRTYVHGYGTGPAFRATTVADATTLNGNNLERTAMDDYDVNDFMGSDFVQKDELKASGPQTKRIASVEQRDGLPRNGKVEPELVLVFSDDKKFGLRTKTNKEVLRDEFGRRTSGWVGKVIELHVDASVRNPQGAKVGGIRIRIPANGAAPSDYTSDLEQGEDDTADPPF